MNNSYLVETGEVLGYCSIIPPVNEEHMFGDKVVKFAYKVGDLLFFNTFVYPKNTQIENNFKYHTPREGQPEKYNKVRDKFKELAYVIDELCPNSREKSTAFTYLETANFWANAGIARN